MTDGVVFVLLVAGQLVGSDEGVAAEDGVGPGVAEDLSGNRSGCGPAPPVLWAGCRRLGR